MATALAVDQATVYRWVRAGRMPAYKLGPGVIRFDPDEVDTWLAGGRTVGGPTPRVPRMPARSTGGTGRLRAVSG